MKSENVVVLERWFEEVWNQQREDRIYELMDERCQIYGLVGDEGKGWECFLPLYKSFLHAFPNIHFTLHDLFDNQDRVALRVFGTGAHLGEFAGLPATGRPISIESIIICRVRDGRICEAWHEVNMAKLFQQISD